MDKISIVYGDDWEGVYINGKLHHQMHKISWINVLADLGFSLERFEVDPEWLEKELELPQDLKNVKRAQ